MSITLPCFYYMSINKPSFYYMCKALSVNSVVSSRYIDDDIADRIILSAFSLLLLFFPLFFFYTFTALAPFPNVHLTYLTTKQLHTNYCHRTFFIGGLDFCFGKDSIHNSQGDIEARTCNRVKFKEYVKGWKCNVYNVKCKMQGMEMRGVKFSLQCRK